MSVDRSAPPGHGDGAAAKVVVLDATPGAALIIPGGAFLLQAHYARQGSDLILTGRDGSQVVIRDFFALETPPDLASSDGALVPSDLAAKLAGGQAPGQYAQAGPAGAAAAAGIGRVTDAKGEVVATRADGTRANLEEGAPVFQGDVLETGAGAEVKVVFIDDTSFRLGANARMVLDELVYDAATNQGSGLFTLVQGLFVFVSGAVAHIAPDNMIIRTPSANIGIRGTEVIFEIAQDGTVTSVTLVSGTIQALRGATPLSPELSTFGDTLTFAGGQAPQVSRMDATQMQQRYGSDAVRDLNLPQQNPAGEEPGGADPGNEGETEGGNLEGGGGTTTVRVTLGEGEALVLPTEDGPIVIADPATNLNLPAGLNVTAPTIVRADDSGLQFQQIIAAAPPLSAPGEQAFALAENAAQGTVVGKVAASGATGFAIVQGNAANAFAIHPNTGEITVANPAVLDFETMPNFGLGIRVTGSSAGDQRVVNVAVNLTDVNEAPVILAQTLALAQGAPGGAPVQVAAADPDAGAVLSYAITAGNDDGLFTIDPQTGAISVATGSLISNGNFERGDFGGWTVANLAGGLGTFLIDHDGATDLSASASVGPASAPFYVVSDQTVPGAHALFQAFTVPAAAIQVSLSFDMFVNSVGGAVVHPAGLDHTAGGTFAPNQHARVDILAAGSGPFDTGAGIVKSLFIGADGGAAPNAFTSYQFDLSGIVVPGSSYILRFAEVDNQGFLNLGVDNVALVAGVGGIDPTAAQARALTVEVTDEAGNASAAVVTVEIGNRPLAVGDIGAAEEAGQMIEGNVLANDQLGDPPAALSAIRHAGVDRAIGVAFETALGGTMVIQADGSYSYTAPFVVGGVETEVFTYTLSDVDQESTQASLRISVEPFVNAVGDVGGNMVIGENALGGVVLREGMVLAVDQLVIGANAAGQGLLTLIDPQTRLTSADPVIVGAAGEGEAVIGAGARLSGPASLVGSQAGGSGSVTIDGVGSTWDAGAYLLMGLGLAQGAGAFTTRVGAGGTGEVAITDGGTLNASLIGIGGGSALTVENTNPTFISAKAAVVGWKAGQGGADLSISGAQASMTLVGQEPLLGIGPGVYVGVGADGTFEVSGASITIGTPGAANGARLTAGGSDVLPGAGDGTIRLLDDAEVLVNGVGARVLIGVNGSGHLEISGNSSLAGPSNQALSAIGLNPGSSGDVLVSGIGSVWFTGGPILIGMQSYNPVTGIGVQGGQGSLTVTANAAVQASSFVVGTGGAINLSAQGRIVGDVVNFGGIVPGNSPGIAYVDGNYTQAAGALEIELGGTSAEAFDQLVVSGQANFLGGAFHFAFIDGYLPSAGDSFRFVSADTLVANVDSLTYLVSGVAPGFRFDVAIDDGGVTLTALEDAPADPAPVVAGTSGDDILRGSDGADVLRGLLGNDYLLGGAGLDILDGGHGADTFAFDLPGAEAQVVGNIASTAFASDIIVDFRSGHDAIEINAANFGISADDIEAGLAFAVIGGAYDGTNAGGGDGARIVIDGTGAVIIDANGDQEGYTIVANVGEATPVAETDIRFV